MDMGNDRELQKSGSSEINVDLKTTARVVESLVLRGDISALNSEERSRFYVQICRSLGLKPATLPFAILRLNGKEVLYPTRGATDQLAAIHRLNREVIDGPRVIDMAGTKLVYAVCRAVHPNGRIETAVATVPLNDPLNCMMKAETKAKRRATLSILGLGMLDETEVEMIPGHAKSPGPTVDVIVDSTPTETPPSLVAFETAVGQMELPGEAVALWIKHRDSLSALPPELGMQAWKVLCGRTAEVGRMNNAKVWLKRAIAEEDARAGAPESDEGPESMSHPLPDDGSPIASGRHVNTSLAPETKATPALDSVDAWLGSVAHAASDRKPGSALVKLGMALESMNVALNERALVMTKFGETVAGFISRINDPVVLSHFILYFDKKVPGRVRQEIHNAVDAAFLERRAALEPAQRGSGEEG